ncbi:MAG: hypothetical protein IJA25_04350 [Anaerotignum sp.]|nr:hypothetical protein [Anaerotignum sp.]
MKSVPMDPLKLVVSIVERGQGKNMIKLYNGQKITHHFQCAGIGTATSEIMDLLGLDSKEKDVIFTVGKATLVNKLMKDLNNDLRGNARSKGIVFDIGIEAVSHILALAVLMPVKDEVGRKDIMMEYGMKNSMILVTVNQGFTEEVMETARKAGARGGTIIHARWAGSESTEEFYGITVQQEKEIIAIVSPADKRKEIMEAVNSNHGMKTEARGTVLSIGIEDMVRLG